MVGAGCFDTGMATGFERCLPLKGLTSFGLEVTLRKTFLDVSELGPETLTRSSSCPGRIVNTSPPPRRRGSQSVTPRDEDGLGEIGGQWSSPPRCSEAIATGRPWNSEAPGMPGCGQWSESGLMYTDTETPEDFRPGVANCVTKDPEDFGAGVANSDTKDPEDPAMPGLESSGPRGARGDGHRKASSDVRLLKRPCRVKRLKYNRVVARLQEEIRTNPHAFMFEDKVEGLPVSITQRPEVVENLKCRLQRYKEEVLRDNMASQPPRVVPPCWPMAPTIVVYQTVVYETVVAATPMPWMPPVVTGMMPTDPGHVPVGMPANTRGGHSAASATPAPKESRRDGQGPAHAAAQQQAAARIGISIADLVPAPAAKAANPAPQDGRRGRRPRR
mmetsp:Transcript_60473/g.187294  ORF Transcript_60473/g.187294 Transcript_60473/m.187294 type:complete len:388 (+) Transcript_60473:59-1222(+)